MNTILEYTYFYVSENISSDSFLLIFKIVESLQCILKLTFIALVLALLCFGRSLAIKDVLINNQPCLARPTQVGFYPDELYYYPFIISLDRCNEICNTVKDP